MAEERRVHPRVSMVLKVVYVDPVRLLPDYVSNFNETGVFICTRESFAVGSTIKFKLSFPSLLDDIPLTGIVKWRRDEGTEGKSPGIGVRFEPADPLERKHLDALIDRIRRPAGAPMQDFRILLVEDNPFAQKLFARTLKKFHDEVTKNESFSLVCAADGRDALVKIQEQKIDLAVVDYYLPVMDGGQVIRAMRANAQYNHTRILVVSAGGDDIRRDTLAAGADLFLDKPVLHKQLLTTLHILLAQPAHGVTP